MLIQLGAIWRPLRTSVYVRRPRNNVRVIDNYSLDLYYVAFPKDTWGPKTLVYCVFVLDTAQTILLTYDIFNTFATHFGDFELLNSLKNEWLSVPVFGGICAQCFWAIL